MKEKYKYLTKNVLIFAVSSIWNKVSFLFVGAFLHKCTDDSRIRYCRYYHDNGNADDVYLYRKYCRCSTYGLQSNEKRIRSEILGIWNPCTYSSEALLPFYF